MELFHTVLFFSRTIIQFMDTVQKACMTQSPAFHELDLLHEGPP